MGNRGRYVVCVTLHDEEDAEDACKVNCDPGKPAVKVPLVVWAASKCSNRRR